MRRLNLLSEKNSVVTHHAYIKGTGTFFRLLKDDLFEGWANVFKLKTPGQEMLASITVAAVALPLNIALAVASGLPPSAGLLAGAIGGILASVFGGASLQVTGPAAALNLMVLSIAQKFGAAGVALAAVFIGLLQLLSGLLRAGGLARHVPESVLTGFMAGVGLKLLDGQIPEFLGFDYTVTEIAKMIHKPDWLFEVSWFAVICGLIVVVTTLSTAGFKRFPGALVGIALATFVSVYLGWDVNQVGEVIIRFDNIGLPKAGITSWASFLAEVLPLAFLASVESLLASSAIDHLSKAKKGHNPNLELIAQSVANLGSGLVGAMPVSGVVVRSTVNIQSGAKTRLSGILHSIILLMAALHFAHIIKIVPLSALAGLLCVVGVRLVDYRSLWHFWKESKLHCVAFIVSMLGTVSGYLMSGLVIGMAIGLFAEWAKKRSKNIAVPTLAPLQHHGVTKKKAEALAYIQKSLRPFHRDKVEESGPDWVEQIRQRAQIAATAFVHGQANVAGRVVLGHDVHIAAGCSVRADEGTPFYIGDNSNIQDGVVIHALKEKWVVVDDQDWAVYVGKNVSLAHQALVHGPSFIDDNCFVGFKAIVHDSIIGKHCFIGHGAMVIGVEIPPERFVPPGMVVDTLDKVEQLPPIEDTHRHFNEDVVDVNRGLVKAYRDQHFKSKTLSGKKSVHWQEELQWKF